MLEFECADKKLINKVLEQEIKKVVNVYGEIETLLFKNTCIECEIKEVIATKVKDLSKNILIDYQKSLGYSLIYIITKEEITKTCVEIYGEYINCAITGKLAISITNAFVLNNELMLNTYDKLEAYRIKTKALGTDLILEYRTDDSNIKAYMLVMKVEEFRKELMNVIHRADAVQYVLEEELMRNYEKLLVIGDTVFVCIAYLASMEYSTYINIITKEMQVSSEIVMAGLPILRQYLKNGNVPIVTI